MGKDKTPPPEPDPEPKAKRVDATAPDLPDFKTTCERYGHDPDKHGVCRDCGSR